jgi:putative ABC transport system permease protein
MRASFQRLRRRLLRVLSPRRIDSQLDDELRFHIESETAAHVARGLSESEARRRALAEMGGVERWREEVRDQRPTQTLEILLRDVALSFRALRRASAYSLPAVATLALGIAAIATIASLTSAVLLRPLPYREPGRLVALWERHIPRNRDRNVVSPTVFDAWRTRSRSLESVTAFMPSSQVWQGTGSPERVFGAEVSPNIFELLGRRPMLGPGFSPGTPTGEVVISHSFWTQRLGADSSIIARAIRLSGSSYNVVGVMPNDFVPVKFGWMSHQDFWLPFNVTASNRNWGRFLVVGGRLKPGATLDALNDELTGISAQLHAEKALTEGWDAHALPLVDEMTGSVKPALLSLALASLLLLALVLTNTSLLTLAHLRQRSPDRALRTALGATTARLRGERAITSALLGFSGAVVGALLTLLAIPLLVRLLPPDLPRLDSVRFDGVAIAAIVAAALLSTAVLALVPAGTAGRDLPNQSARLTKRSRGAWLIVAETSLALVLAVLASLTVRSFDRLRAVELGFDPSNLIAFRVSLEASGAPRSAPQIVFDRLLDRLRAVPGIEAVGLASVRPFRAGGSATSIGPLGSGSSDRAALPVADVRVVDRGYFDALNISANSGRLFSGSEVRGQPPLAVVNEALLRAVWPAEPNAVGRKFDLNMYDNIPPEIIGVVRDVRLTSPRLAPRPTVYLSAAQFPSEVFDVVVRSGLGAAVIPTIRPAVTAVAPGTPIYEPGTLSSIIAESMARERVTAFLLAFFAVAALLLVAVGVYGLFAGEVARGRQEIGVRIALGERGTRLVGSMLARAMLRAGAGVLIGIAASVMATRAVRGMLYGVLPSDTLSHATAVSVVLVTAFIATLLPALQAARVDPVRALRAD